MNTGRMCSVIIAPTVTFDLAHSGMYSATIVIFFLIASKSFFFPSLNQRSRGFHTHILFTSCSCSPKS
ncbi:MAG: hypothetical protein WBL64_01830, partial [Nitrososphaeraceae archaeon]